MQLISLPDSSPLVTLRILFRTGSAQDPEGKGGAAWMTALQLASGGSRTRSNKEILDAFFPLATSVGSQVDKEMIAFSAETHRDNLDAFYEIFRAMLLDPGWRSDDFQRLRDDAVNYLESGLRAQNDEEFAKEMLYQCIYRDHPYERHNAGSISSLKTLTLSDLREFYTAHFTRENLTICLAGGYPADFERRIRQDFSCLPPKARPQQPIAAPASGTESNVLFIEKPARGVAISLGFPIGVRRGHPDFPALLLATSALGQHRMSSGRLFNRMRQIRGLNYGDYAYIEYFPGGMYSLEPEPNLARSHQIFQLWIRPVEHHHAHFALRLAIFELDRLIRHGLDAEEFERTRRFLPKYSKLLLKTKDAELGYLADSAFYQIPPYPEYLERTFAQLTLEQVNAAIGRHLHTDSLQVVMVGEDLAALRDGILANRPSPLEYTTPKPDEILTEDVEVANLALNLKARLMPAEDAFA
ncbi:MAG: insulinase family protein [Acidobacteria bacterium]|nr:insulinase family protein [Acidobacteriota bacterium]